MSATRFVAWNVHHCRGLDLRVMPERVVDLVAALEPDVVALSELDVGRRRSRRLDQPAWIAARLSMHVVFAETLEGYGHALFSRRRPDDASVIPLTHAPVSEPRSAIDARIGGVRVIATHLGLSVMDRAVQADELLVVVRRSSEPVVLLGDLNAGPGERAFEALLAAPLRDAFGSGPVGQRATWPSPFAFRPLDHVLHAPSLRTLRTEILGSRTTRIASDHLPVIVDFDLP